MLTISDSEDAPGQSSVAGPSKLKVGKKKRKLGYMLDVAPSLPDLPPRHTWKRSVVRSLLVSTLQLPSQFLSVSPSPSRLEKAL